MMIKRNMINSIARISSIQDDAWYQVAGTKRTLESVKAKGEKVVFAPKSMTETLFWLSEPSGTWQIIVNPEYAKEFGEVIQILGVAETLKAIK